MRSQEDAFISLVTKHVLNRAVSEVLVSASRELHKEENQLFMHAVSLMKSKGLPFWVAVNDA